jgi:trk system potassium uptake protein TrkA
VFGEIDTMVGALSIAITHPRITHSMVLGRGASIAFEFVVPGAARVAGKTVREIGTSPGFPRGAVIAGIEEADGDVVAPRGDSVVQGGRAVLLVAKREDVQAALDMMTEVAEVGS